MGTSVTATGITFPDATTQTTAASSAFPAGTLMLFQQTSAPTGWTKQTTHNDKALRVVSGTASSGGSVGFSTAMATPAVDTSGLSAGATTLATTQIPSHAHSYTSPAYGGANGSSVQYANTTGDTTGAAGGGGSHTHSLSGSATATINVQYVDLIIASKN